MATTPGVFPVYENQFKVGSDKETAKEPSNIETFSVEFSNGVETWNPMDQKGWQIGRASCRERV